MTYLARINQASDAGHFKAGHVYSTHVEHQAGCHYQHGACTCWPYITAVNQNTDEIMVIGSNGHILERRRRS